MSPPMHQSYYLDNLALSPIPVGTVGSVVDPDSLYPDPETDPDQAFKVNPDPGF
jgi:hypothetical protein